MKCYSCGFENEEGASFCHKCGVNLKKDDMKTFKDNANVLNKTFKVNKRKSYPTPSADSIQAKLLYKHDKHTGKLRIAKTKCATLIVFCGFTGFGLIVYSFMLGFPAAILAAVLLGLVFAVPVAIVGYILGWIIDKILH